MPTYLVDLTIPAQTRMSSPVSTRLTLTGPYIQRGSILFPDGCLGLVGIRITNHGRQIIPEMGWVTGNGNPPVVFGGYRPEGPDWDFFIEGYNMARDWPHTVRIMVET